MPATDVQKLTYRPERRNEGSGANPAAKQRFSWLKRPYFIGLIAVAIVVFWVFMPSNPPALVRTAVVSEIKLDQVLAMYRQDKQVVAAEKPSESPSVIPDKPKATSLPSVREAPARRKPLNKPAPLRPSIPGGQYRHQVSTAVNLPPG